MNESLRDAINRALTLLWVVADSDAPYNEIAMDIAESLEYELDKPLQKEGETYN